MYSVEIVRKGKARTYYFEQEWQAAQFVEMFLDKDPIMKGPKGQVIPLYAECCDDEY